MNSERHYLVMIIVANCSDRHQILPQYSPPSIDVHYLFADFWLTFCSYNISSPNMWERGTYNGYLIPEIEHLTVGDKKAFN